jgi:hypothetical protein
MQLRDRRKSTFYGPLIQDTGQGYKLTMSMCVTGIGGALLVFSEIGAHYLLEPLACAIIFGGVFGAALWVSCPKGGCRFVWEAMRHQPLSTWTNVMVATQCPRCEFDPNDQEQS